MDCFHSFWPITSTEVEWLRWIFFTVDAIKVFKLLEKLPKTLLLADLKNDFRVCLRRGSKQGADWVLELLVGGHIGSSNLGNFLLSEAIAVPYMSWMETDL